MTRWEKQNWLGDRTRNYHCVAVAFIYYTDKDKKMAKKKGFLNFYLNGSDREDVKALAESDDFLSATIERFGVDGHKIAFNFKPKFRSWVVSVTTDSQANSNCDWILSDFGDTPESALARVAFYHYEICVEGEWTSNMTSVKEFDD